MHFLVRAPIPEVSRPFRPLAMKWTAPFLIVACAWFALGATTVALAETKYEQDIAYLLDEFEKQAAQLLRDKDVDWKAVRKEFGASAKAVKSDVEHVELCGRLLARLQDGHAAFTRVDVKMPQKPKEHGVGLSLCEQDEKVLVKQAFGPAAASGIESGYEVVSVDGRKALEWLDAKTKALAAERCFSSAHAARYAACHWGLAGEDGKTIEFEFDRGKKGRKKLTLTHDKSGGEARYVGPIFPPTNLKQIGRRDAYTTLASGYAYVYLGEVADDLESELDIAMAEIGRAPGLILDARANNGGGADHAAVFGRFLAPGTKWNQYTAAGKASFAGPMVVIVDAGTRSAGETIAGQFKEDGRAYMIGPSPTHGMSAQKVEIEPPSKLFQVRIATGSNKQRFNGGKGIEGLGVAPHEIVAWDPKLMVVGVDPMIRRAEELLAKGFPKGVVPYVPPKSETR